MFVLHCVFTLHLWVFPQNSSAELWNNYFVAINNSLQKGRDKDGGGVVYVEYISLHGYIRNTSSDTEVHVENQLRANRST